MAEGNKPPISCDVWNKTTFGPKVERTFLWSFEAFKERFKSFEDGEMLSTFFSLRGPEECVTKWQLDLYPKPNTGSLVLQSLSKNIRAIPSISLLGRQGNKMNPRTSSAATKTSTHSGTLRLSVFETLKINNIN